MIKHVCDFCGEDLSLGVSMNIYKIPIFEKMYATKQGKKLAEFTISIKPQEVELCPTCEKILAETIEKFNDYK